MRLVRDEGVSFLALRNRQERKASHFLRMRCGVEFCDFGRVVW